MTTTDDRRVVLDLPGPGQHVDSLPAATVQPEEPEPASRLLRLLRDKAAALSAAPTFRYPVPVWDGMLWVEYTAVDEAKVAQVRKEAAELGTPVGKFYGMCLLEHVNGVLVRDDSGRLVSADLGSPQRPAPRIDERLAAALGWDYAGGDDLLLRLYGTEGYVTSTWDALQTDCGYARTEEIRASRGNG